MTGAIPEQDFVMRLASRIKARRERCLAMRAMMDRIDYGANDYQLGGWTRADDERILRHDVAALHEDERCLELAKKIRKA